MAQRQAYKRASEYRRRAPSREPYDVVLVICEGRKTEPLYFKRLRAVHRLSSANIEVLTSPGTDPMSILAFAESRLKDGDYDKVFCVFDRDGHQTFDEAMRRFAELSVIHPDRIFAIVSWPCFELWLLLHFGYSARPFERTARASSCDMVISELRRHLPKYQKGIEALYDELQPLQATALGHSVSLARENQKTGASNPSTKVHDLVIYLLNLRGR